MISTKRGLSSVNPSLRIQCLATLVCLAALLPSLRAAERERAEVKPAKIQIAILLDTSGSMDGLIEQAKAQLWRIVNDLATTKRNGLTPELSVALYEYGKSSLEAQGGYLQMLSPLTTDLDKVSESLFELTTNGGDEYCGWVIQSATSGLQWSPGPHDYKAIFIAGNEPFSQGAVDFRNSCAEAIKKGIVVNTIFCGAEAEGIRGHWKEGADLADGRFMVIDHQRALVVREAPQDRQILELGKALNQTYLAYGAAGREAQSRQVAQDRNAAAMAEEVAVERTVVKASKMYKAESWDLVEAEAKGSLNVEELDDEALPEPMRGMTDGEKQAYIQKQAEERQRLQKKIQQLQSERQKYLAERSRQEGTLDDAVLGAVRSQLKAKSFEFENNR